MSIKGKFLKRPSGLILFRDKPAGAATTITAAAAAGAATITVASATGVTAGKSFRVGGDEDIERVEVASVAALVVTLVKPLLRAHASGEAAVEQNGYQIGAIKGGVKTTHTKETTDEFNGMSRLVFAKLDGFQSFGVEFMLQGYTLPNLCFALGIPLTRLFGAGTSIAAPINMATDLNDSDSESNVCVVASYQLQDGTTIVEEFWGCSADYSALSLQLAFGQAGSIPVKLNVYGGGAQSDVAITATPLTTYRATKAKVFGKLSAVGLFLSAGAGSTVGTAAAADATTLLVVDGTPFTAGSWIGIATDDTFEAHWLASKATNTLTLKTNLLRTQAIGVSVIPLTQLPFASLTRDGATFSVGGSSEPLQIGTRDLPIGTQPGPAEASMTLRLQELTNVARAYLLGIPQANIANGRVLITDAINTAITILGTYVTGVLKDGTVNMVNQWGVTQDLSDLGAEMTTGANTSRQFAAKATSGIQFVQYAT